MQFPHQKFWSTHSLGPTQIKKTSPCDLPGSTSESPGCIIYAHKWVKLTRYWMDQSSHTFSKKKHMCVSWLDGMEAADQQTTKGVFFSLETPLVSWPLDTYGPSQWQWALGHPLSSSQVEVVPVSRQGGLDRSWASLDRGKFHAEFSGQSLQTGHGIPAVRQAPAIRMHINGVCHLPM